MYYSKNKRKSFFIGTLTIASLLAGCGNTLPEMTMDEQAMVTEYATNLLVKYSPLSDRALLDEEQLEEGIARETEEMERYMRTEEIADAYLQAAKNGNKVEEKESSDDKQTSSEATEMVPQKSISQFFEEENNFSIEYTSYQLCDSYPESDGEEVFMAMDATEGNKLCIVRFLLKNLASTEQSLDMFAKQARFSLRMGDGTLVSAQSTLLEDDLSSYMGNVSQGEEQEVVLVFEVPEQIEQIDSMDLIMSNDSGENILTLQ